MLREINSVIPINECTLIADKAYDVKAIYNTVKSIYDGECAIPLNQRKPLSLACSNVICETGLAMHKDGKTTPAADFVRNIAVRSNALPTTAPALAHTRATSTARRIAAAPSMSLCPTITVSPLIVLVFHLRKFTLFALRSSVTTLGSSRPVRNACGYVRLTPSAILTLSLTSLFWLLPPPPLSPTSTLSSVLVNPLFAPPDRFFGAFFPPYSGGFCRFLDYTLIFCWRTFRSYLTS